mgnify:CR=1 FL=1
MVLEGLEVDEDTLNNVSNTNIVWFNIKISSHYCWKIWEIVKFFRKIRYNLIETGKTTKYFKYAIGEIVLVVIGILIALQINNWNENRKKNQTLKIALTNIVNDLKFDQEQLKFEANLYNVKTGLVEKTYSFVNQINP